MYNIIYTKSRRIRSLLHLNLRIHTERRRYDHTRYGHTVFLLFLPKMQTFIIYFISGDPISILLSKDIHELFL